MSKKQDRLIERIEKLEKAVFVGWTNSNFVVGYTRNTPVNIVMQALLDYLKVEIDRTPAQPAETVIKKRK